MLTVAKGDLTTAFNDAAGRTVDPIAVSGNLGGQTLFPGLYKSVGSLEITAGDLTLDAGGNADAVWIFQIATSFNMNSGRQIFLINSANAANIYWQVGSLATFGTTSVMKGTVMADGEVNWLFAAKETGAQGWVPEFVLGVEAEEIALDAHPHTFTEAQTNEKTASCRERIKENFIETIHNHSKVDDALLQ
jgi:hypothetical protein